MSECEHAYRHGDPACIRCGLAATVTPLPAVPPGPVMPSSPVVDLSDRWRICDACAGGIGPRRPSIDGMHAWCAVRLAPSGVA